MHLLYIIKTEKTIYERY